jgi:hypothetical protein
MKTEKNQRRRKRRKKEEERRIRKWKKKEEETEEEKEEEKEKKQGGIVPLRLNVLLKAHCSAYKPSKHHCKLPQECRKLVW